MSTETGLNGGTQAKQSLVTNETISVGGLHMSYRHWRRATNSAAQNPPFLLIHGLASASRIWDLVAVELLKSGGSDLIALDQRGHGQSDKPDNGYSNDQIVADDYALANLLKLEKPVVVGHSWGATIALAYAAKHPEAVSGLVLVDGGMGNMRSRPDLNDWEIVAKRLAPPEFAGTPRETFLDFYRRGPLGAIWNETLADIVLNIVQVRTDNTVAPRLSRANHLQILRALWESDNIELARQVSCPMLMISAEADPSDDWAKAKREGAAQMQAAARVAQVEFVAMPDTIHDIPLQRPAALAQKIVEFGKAVGFLD